MTGMALELKRTIARNQPNKNKLLLYKLLFSL